MRAHWCSARKILGLRLWSNPEGSRAWDQDVVQAGLEVLCVSQFTLFGRLKGKGKPDYSKAMPPQQARLGGSRATRAVMNVTQEPAARQREHCRQRRRVLQSTTLTPLPCGALPPLQRVPAPPLQARQAYAAFIQRLGRAYVPERVKDGVFGAMMDVSLVSPGCGGWPPYSHPPAAYAAGSAGGCGRGTWFVARHAPCNLHPAAPPSATTAPSPSCWTAPTQTTRGWAAVPAPAACPAWMHRDASSKRQCTAARLLIRHSSAAGCNRRLRVRLRLASRLGWQSGVSQGYVAKAWKRSLRAARRRCRSL